MESRISIITLAVSNLQKSYDFYALGLGLETSRKPEDGIVFFQTTGTCFALYPQDKMKEEVEKELTFNRADQVYGGFTLAHNVRTKEEVDLIIKKAEKAGATIEKKPADTFWGGYSGYFSDPEGYLWEVAWGAFDFNEDGTLIIN